jgi:hypothetical protein
MKKLFTVINTRRSLIINLMELGILILGALTAFLFYSHFDKVFGNSASRLLLVLAPFLEIGKPYTDVWEFVPPGFLAVVSAWVYVFGWGMVSLKVLQILVLVFIGVLFLLVIKKLYTYAALELSLFVSFVLIFYSPILQTDMLSIELFGIMFALSGLATILYVKNELLAVFIGALFFFLSSQMKETLTFTVIAMVPYFAFLVFKYKSLQKTIKISFAGGLGVGLGAIMVLLYLIINDSLSGYKGIIEYKLSRVVPFGSVGSVFSGMSYLENLFAENFLHNHNYLKNLFLLNIFIVLYKLFSESKYKKVKKGVFKLVLNLQKIKGIGWMDWSSLFFGVGIFLGLIMYKQYSVDTRLIPVTVAFFILFGLLAKYLLNNIFKDKTENKFGFYILLLLLAVFMSPQTKVVKAFLHQLKLHASAEIFGNTDLKKYYVRTAGTEINNYIFENTTTTDCILNPYGWEVAETYIYSKRKPCTKYFLANMALSDKRQITEYANEILSNPPKAILYNTSIIDLNIDNFSKNVIDYPSAIKYCYNLDEKFRDYPYLITGTPVKVNLYWRKENLSQVEFKNCFNKHATPAVQEENTN